MSHGGHLWRHGQSLCTALSALSGLLLLADALVLMAYGQFNLGVMIPFFLGLGLTFLAWRWRAVHAWLAHGRYRRQVWRSLWVLFWLWLVSLLAFWSWLLQGDADQDLSAAQAMIVLGSATRDGQPSPALAMRLDKAAELAQQLPGLPIVVSGGVDWGQVQSEAAVMASYLQRRHAVAQTRLMQEGQSTSTDLNLQLSAQLLRERGVDVKTAAVIVVTSDFHTLRAAGIAYRQGYAKVITQGAPVPWSTRPNAWLREYFAVLSSWLLAEI